MSVCEWRECEWNAGSDGGDACIAQNEHSET